MARTACLMMQKDEVLLLRPWLLHHGYLFGYENLYVWDNGSTAPEVLEILAQFQGLGVNVDYSKTTPAEFSGKGQLVGDKIIELCGKHRYDVALPLDCDEFVAIDSPGGVSCARNLILAELQRIGWHSLICQTLSGLYSLPGQFGLFQRAEHKKSIMAVREFHGIDHGFHNAHLPAGAHYAPTSLIYLHLHYRPYAAFIASAKDKLRPWTNPDDLEALKTYEGVGKHLVRYLFMTEAEYYALDFGDEPRRRIPALGDFLAAHMDAQALILAWGQHGTAPAVAAPQGGGSQNFEALRAAGLKAMEIDDYAAAAGIWAQCRTMFPIEEEGYLYGAVAAKAAGDDILLGQIHAEQARRFPNVFS